MMQEERFAQNIREAGERIRQAHIGLARANAEEARTVARVKVASGEKSDAAQKRFADEDSRVFQARLDVGVAEGELAASRAELKACEARFEEWRTRMANARQERRSYGV